MAEKAGSWLSLLPLEIRTGAGPSDMLTGTFVHDFLRHGLTGQSGV